MNYLNFRLLGLDSIYVASYLATGFHRRDAVAALKKRLETSIAPQPQKEPRDICSNALDRDNPKASLLGRYILPLKDFVNKNLAREQHKL
jgi:hypothetical protein